MAEQCQGRCGEVQAITVVADGLTYSMIRFLKRPFRGQTRFWYALEAAGNKGDLNGDFVAAYRSARSD